jgi:hypothetical protein
MSELVLDSDFRLDPDLDPWDQQEGEPDEYFAAFRRYCRLARRVNPRSGEPLPRKIGEMVADTRWSHRHVKRLSLQYHWGERADAWDVDRENDLAGKIADARVTMLHDRIDVLGEISGITMTVLREKDPSEWKVRDVVELLKIQFMAQDTLLGLTQRGAANYSGVGVDISLPIGQNTSEIEGQIDEIMAELVARRPTGVISSDPDTDDD